MVTFFPAANIQNASIPNPLALVLPVWLLMKMDRNAAATLCESHPERGFSMDVINTLPVNLLHGMNPQTINAQIVNRCWSEG